MAHPTVGAGVRDHSDFEQRPWERLLRSLDWVSLLVYRGREAIVAGRRLRALHQGLKSTREDGKPCYALDPEVYAWPPGLRDRLGITWTARDERASRALGSVARRLTAVMPQRLQVTGPDQLRMRRRAIARGPLGSEAARASSGTAVAR